MKDVCIHREDCNNYCHLRGEVCDFDKCPLTTEAEGNKKVILYQVIWSPPEKYAHYMPESYVLPGWIDDKATAVNVKNKLNEITELNGSYRLIEAGISEERIHENELGFFVENDNEFLSDAFAFDEIAMEIMDDKERDETTDETINVNENVKGSENDDTTIETDQ